MFVSWYLFASLFLGTSVTNLLAASFVRQDLDDLGKFPDSLMEEVNETSCGRGNLTRYDIIAIQWLEVHVPYTILVWVLLASGVKVGKYDDQL